MAKQPFNISPFELSSQTVLCDLDGKVIIDIGYSDFTVHTRKGIEQHQIGTCIQTVDGRQWSPLQMRSQPPVHVGVCSHCRKPPFRWWGREKPTHGIVTLQRAHTCVECGTLCCPRHYKKGRDGNFRCKPCNSKRRLSAKVKSIFFTNVEEV
jgi:hypothetical protein